MRFSRCALELGEDVGAVGGVANDEITLTRPVNQHVVDQATAAIGHQRVLDLTDLKVRDVVGGDVLDPFEGVGAVEFQAAHVADVEEAGTVPHGLVLLDDRRVLDRHQPPAEFDHPAAKGLMGGEKRRFQGGFNVHRTFSGGPGSGARSATAP